MLTKNFQKLQSEVASHVEADKVAQDSYQTCFIGCLAKKRNDPEFIQSEYGIPLAVSRIAEAIFEGLPAAEAPLFFAAFPAAVGCDGKDLTRVVWQFLAAELRSLPAAPDNVQTVIDSVIAGMDRLASGLEWKEAEATASMAQVMPWLSAIAAIAADTAAIAARAADAAATRAADATRAAARLADAPLCQRDLLLKLIKEAPVV